MPLGGTELFSSPRSFPKQAPSLTNHPSQPQATSSSVSELDQGALVASLNKYLVVLRKWNLKTLQNVYDELVAQASGAGTQVSPGEGWNACCAARDVPACTGQLLGSIWQAGHSKHKLAAHVAEYPRKGGSTFPDSFPSFELNRDAGRRLHYLYLPLRPTYALQSCPAVARAHLPSTLHL